MNVKRANWLTTLTAAVGFSGLASAQVLPPQPEYVPLLPPPTSSERPLSVIDGFRTQTGILFAFGWNLDNSTEGYRGKTFFCPGATQTFQIQDCFMVINRGASYARSYTNDHAPVTQQYGLIIGGDNDSRSRLEGNPSENDMSLSCPSGQTQEVDVLTEEQKADIMERIQSGEIRLHALPDIYNRPEGFRLTDGSTLIILQNDSNWSDHTRQMHRIFLGRPGEHPVEVQGRYHDGRSSSLPTQEGHFFSESGEPQRRAGFRIQGLGTLLLPNISDRFRGTPEQNQPRLNGTPVSRLGTNDLADLLGIVQEDPAFSTVPLITPCSNPGVGGPLVN